MVLSLMTFASLILCQFHGCCGASSGSTDVFLARVLSVALGCLAAAAVSNLVAPWYTSQESLESLAAVLRQCAALMVEMYGEPGAGAGGVPVSSVALLHSCCTAAAQKVAALP